MARRPNDPLWRRHQAELVVVAVGVVLVAVLWFANRGSGSDSQASTTTSTSTTLPTDQPDTTGPEGTSATTGNAAGGDGAGRSAETALDQAVLRRSDLPSGWTEMTVSGSAAVVCAGQDPLGAARPITTARALFTSSSGGRVIGGTVAAFAGPDGASALLSEVKAAAKACSGGPGSFEVVRLPRVGDETVGVVFEVPSGGSVTRGVMYLSRVGARAAVISATATGEEVDRDLVLRALRAESGRL